MLFYVNIIKDFNIILILLHNQIDYYRCDLYDLLTEMDELNSNKSITKCTRLLHLNYISLSELSYSIKEYFLLNNILLL